MQDRPTAEELLAAVRGHLEREVVPRIEDARLKFQTLVCLHVLGIVERELMLGETLARAEWTSLAALLDDPAGQPTYAETRERLAAGTRALCRQIRAGSWDEDKRRHALLGHVRATVKTKLFIANPRYKSVGE